MLYLITGGVRSGKSRYAEALAEKLGEQTVLYIATLTADDDEMKRRIVRHRATRPAAWRTAEAADNVATVLSTAQEDVVLVDCLSGLVTNLVLAQEPAGEEAVIARVLEHVRELTAVITATGKTVIVVSNEVGAGVVPAYPLGRWYRDALGLANQQLARAASAVALVTVGIPQTLKGTFPEVNHDI